MVRKTRQNIGDGIGGAGRCWAKSKLLRENIPISQNSMPIWDVSLQKWKIEWKNGRVFNCNPNGLIKWQVQPFHFVLSILVRSIFECVPTYKMEVPFCKCIPFCLSILKMERFSGNGYHSIFHFQKNYFPCFFQVFSRHHRQSLLNYIALFIAKVPPYCRCSILQSAIMPLRDARLVRGRLASIDLFLDVQVAALSKILSVY